jgi:hypothetical protein
MKVWARPSMHALGGLVGLHLEYEDLLAYRDGELSRVGRWCVCAHLSRCHACRREAELLEEDLVVSKKIDDLLFTSDVLNLQIGQRQLRRAIEDWETQRKWDGDDRGPAKALGERGLRQLAAESTIYLGERATATLLSRMKNRDRSYRDPLLEAESVLSDFLGPGAAAAIAQRISYTQLAGARSGQRPHAS